MTQGIYDSFAWTKAAQECMSTTTKQEEEIQKQREEIAALKTQNEALQKQNAELKTSCTPATTPTTKSTTSTAKTDSKASSENKESEHNGTDLPESNSQTNTQEMPAPTSNKENVAGTKQPSKEDTEKVSDEHTAEQKKHDAEMKILNMLITVKYIEDLSNSYETRSKMVNCYTAKLKQHRECLDYYNNRLSDECVLYRVLIDNCMMFETKVEKCKFYNTAKHEACYKVSTLCKGTSPGDFTKEHKQKDQDQLKILRNKFADMERKAGFGVHTYGKTTAQDVREEARELQREAIQKVVKDIDTVFGEKLTHAKDKILTVAIGNEEGVTFKIEEGKNECGLVTLDVKVNLQAYVNDATQHVAKVVGEVCGGIFAGC